MILQIIIILNANCSPSDLITLTSNVSGEDHKASANVLGVLGVSKLLNREFGQGRKRVVILLSGWKDDGNTKKYWMQARVSERGPPREAGYQQHQAEDEEGHSGRSSVHGHTEKVKQVMSVKQMCPAESKSYDLSSDLWSEFGENYALLLLRTPSLAGTDCRVLCLLTAAICTASR